MECVKSLLNKEVINVCSGENIGCVCDILVDIACGRVSKIVIPKGSSLISYFSKEGFIYINWCDVVKVGENLILVETNTKQR